MKQNSLVVYYTHSANTRKIAEIICEKTKGTLFEILPAEAYPADYDAVVKQAKKEIGAGYRPDLATDIDVTPYDVIYVGTPNWWSTMAPPVAALLAVSLAAMPSMQPVPNFSGCLESLVSVE